MKTLCTAPLAVMTWVLRPRIAGGSGRDGIRSVCAALVGMTLFATIPLQTAIASEVQVDRIWEIELRGRVQSFNPSRLTIDVDNNLHRLSYNFQVIRDGRVVDPGEIGPDAFVILDKRAGAVKRIFVMEEEPR